jgi:hypothetical protein
MSATRRAVAAASLAAIAGVVLVASVVEAVREKSWGPVLVNAWVPAVLLASLYRPTPGRECQPLRRGRARP